MNYEALAVVAGFALIYSLVASRLERTPISGALVYVIAGFLCSPYVFRLIDIKIDGEGLSRLAELTLALVLFTDSANTNLATLRKVESIPVRLLLIGLPLTILFGFGVAYLIFDGLGLFELALLATMLAPTDAALGKGGRYQRGCARFGPRKLERGKWLERWNLRAGTVVFPGSGGWTNGCRGSGGASGQVTAGGSWHRRAGRHRRGRSRKSGF